jgi:hypothetical protein
VPETPFAIAIGTAMSARKAQGAAAKAASDEINTDTEDVENPNPAPAEDPIPLYLEAQRSNTRPKTTIGVATSVPTARSAAAKKDELPPLKLSDPLKEIIKTHASHITVPDSKVNKKKQWPDEYFQLLFVLLKNPSDLTKIRDLPGTLATVRSHLVNLKTDSARALAGLCVRTLTGKFKIILDRGL